MAGPEIIDLTDSPVLVASADSKDVPAISLLQNQDVLGGETTTKKKRKRRRKHNRGVPNRDSLAATTKNTSNEEFEEEADASQDPPQAKRKHEDGSLTPKIDTSSPVPQDRISSLKKHKHHREVRVSSTGNTDLNEDLYFEDTTPAPLPSAINLPPPPYDTVDPPSQNSIGTKLLLPAHVSVLGSTPVEILPPTDEDEDEDDADYIKYLDYGGERQKVGSNGFNLVGVHSSSTGVSAVF